MCIMLLSTNNILQEAAKTDKFYHLEAVTRSNGVEKTFLTSTKAVALLLLG